MKNELPVTLANRAVLAPVFSFLFLWLALTAPAQTNMTADGNSHDVSYNGSYQDFKIPINVTYSKLTLTARGADGGRRRYSGFCTARAGEGATTVATFDIGCGSNQISPGSTIRFIIGHEGTKNDGGGVEGGGGGGGTGILVKEPGDADWTLLSVAGGGGGAFLNGLCDDSDGRGGTTGTSGSDGKGSNHGNGGTNGNGGQSSTQGNFEGTGGGGWLTDGENELNCDVEPGNGGGAGGTTGGDGGGDGTQTGCGVSQKGGFGFGGGGGGIGSGGGGGGYSGGGGGGYQGGGGGGGSYVNSMAASSSITGGGTVADGDPGSCQYQFTNNTGSAIASISAVCNSYTINITNCPSGTLSLTAAQLAANSSVSCGNIDLTSSYSFDCNDAGQTVNTTVSVGDGIGNTKTCVSAVTVKAYPVALCKNITVNLNSSGSVTVNTSQLNNGSYDPDGGSVSVGFFTLGGDDQNVTYHCSDYGTNSQALLVTDNEGDLSYCVSTITVADVADPTVSCKSATVNLNSSGTGSITTSSVYQSASDNCGTINQVSVSPSSFTCSNIGTNIVTLTVNDGHGNTATCNATVTVADNTAPSVTCKSATVNLNSGGTGSITTASVYQTGSDNCGTVNQVSVSPSSFTCSNLGANTVTLTVNDGHGNTKTCTATVTVADNTTPTVTCKNATVSLNSGGTGSITTSNVYNTGSDNCGTINQQSVSPSSFTCSNIGTNTVTLTVNDSHGNTATCTATVTVSDNIAPSVSCKSATVNLNSSGTGSITTASVYQTGSDNCGTVNQVSVSPSSFTCSNIGTNTVTLSVNDGHGNTASCTATVTVADNMAPSVTCVSSKVVNLDASGSYTFSNSELVQSSSDNCGSVTVSSISPASVNCNNLMNSPSVTVTVSDGHGNTATCQVSVLVNDNMPPSLSCKNATVSLNSSGQASIAYSDVAASLSDNCTVIFQLANPNTFDCSNIGSNSVTVYAGDNGGNLVNCTATVTVVDNITPTVSCKNATVYLGSNGTVSLSGSDVTQSSSDNCTLTPSISPSSLNCNNLGTNVITLSVSDPGGNSASCTATVTVADNMAPSVTCVSSKVVNLGASGSYTFSNSELIQNSSDNCGSVTVSSISPASVNCNNLMNSPSVTVTVSDGHGNTATCQVNVLVNDNTPPSLSCQNTTVSLNSSGQASASFSDVATVSDNCTVIFQLVNPNTFDCSKIGSNSVTVYAGDNGGNLVNCSATVTVVDNTAPSVSCKNATVNLDASGSAGITTASVYQSGSDNCGTVNQVSVSPSSLTCSNIGTNTVTLTVNDGHGNTATCTAAVTLSDNIAPTVTCKNANVSLSATGTASISAADVFQSGSDNCGTVNQVSVSPNAFTCSNLGTNTVTLTVNDGHGNTNSCTATVTVQDAAAPSVTCKNATVNLNAAGSGSITTASVFQNGSDNCGTVNQVSVSPNAFTCSNFGTNTVTLTVNDGHGNTATCTATVTVADNIAPSVTCVPNKTVNLDASGSYTFSNTDLVQSSSDNCGTVSVSSISPTAITCSNIVNPLSVTLIVSDGHGNTATCQSSVVANDNILPDLTCKNATVSLNAAGQASITFSDVAESVSDNCSVVVQELDPSDFNCNNIGPNSVTVYAADFTGNLATCTATVTVVDDMAPSVSCKNATLYLDASGSASLAISDIYQSGSDNCGVVNQQSVSTSTFNCGYLGANTVTLTVNDGHGNTNTCTAIVTVADNIPPVAVCGSIVVNLDASGQAVLVPGNVLSDATHDNCNSYSAVSASPATFNCSNYGDNAVLITIQDNSGNTATCTGNVFINDISSPSVTCKNAAVTLNASGSGSITTASVFQSGSDNCGTVNLESVSPNTFTCSNLGTNTVTLTANDGHDNTATCTATVTVSDLTAPSVSCKDKTVNLNASGSGSITTSDVFQSGSDNCGTVNQVAVSPNAFTCSNLGTNTVTLTVNDGHGNTNSCTATVTVQDVTAPSVTCKPATVNLDASGTGSITTVSVFQSGSDNCGTVNQVAVSPNAFTCSNLGANTVTLTVNDGHGNTNTCTATVTVQDVTAPSVTCKPVTVNLDASGTGSITTASVFQSGSDNCGTVNQVSVSPNAFTCSNLGTNTVTLTVNDGHGNTNTCTATVTVQDVTAPSVVCKNATVNLDGSGAGSITTASVFQSGSDNCGTVNQVSVSPNAFTCSNLGTNTVTLTVNDGHGNTNTCTATVTVQDVTAPSVVCKNATVNLDGSGAGSITTASVFQSGSDNCGTVNQVAVSPNAFTCSNLGANTVTLTVNDGHGNTNSCTATVTVQDVTAPSVTCKPATVNLDASGAGSITTASVFQSGSDNCGTVNQVAVSPNAFTCTNLGTNTVTLTVNDGHGNTGTCTATVTVVDAIAPTMICKNVTLNLDASGNATLTVAQVNNGSYDNCSIAGMALTQTTFTCANIGDNSVQLNGSDQSGNKGGCTAIITVKDPILPVAKCKNYTANLGSTGSVTVSGASLDNGTSDNCSFSLTLTPSVFSCSNIGANTVTLKATDAGGNTATCTAIVTIKDVTAPTAICKNATVYLNSAGLGSLAAGDVNNGSTDNCSISAMSVNTTQFNCSDISTTYYVTLTVKDAGNNSATCTATVLVKDNLAPTAVCQNVTVQLSAQGKTSVSGAALAANSYDNCSVWSYSPISKQYTTANVGVNNLSITVKDWSGNASTCVSQVTVLPYGGGMMGADKPEMPHDPGAEQGAVQAENRDNNRQAESSELHVFPNPVKGDVTLQFELPDGQGFILRVFDLAGRTVLDGEGTGIAGGNSLHLDLNDQAAGLYLIDIQSGGQRLQKKLVIQKD